VISSLEYRGGSQKLPTPARPVNASFKNLITSPTAKRSRTVSGDLTPAPFSSIVASPAKSPLMKLSLDANARDAGLSYSEIQRLDKYLDSLKGADLDGELKLANAALESPNPDRAARTYLAMIDRRGSGRVTADIVDSLVMGVGNARTSTTEGREGILGEDAAIRAAMTLTIMPKADYDQISNAFHNARSQTERALILKSVAAREKAFESGAGDTATQEIVNFADQIRGGDSATLIKQTTFVDLDGDGVDEGLKQRWNNTCVPTTAQIMRAENDPIWALKYYNEIDSISNADDLGIQEATILQNAGSTPVVRDPKNPGGDGMQAAAALDNLVSPATATTYWTELYGDSTSELDRALNDMETYLKGGIDVPIGVGWPYGGGHLMLATDVRGSGDSREFLISDPWTGHTGWIKAKDIESGSANFFADTGRLTELNLPSTSSLSASTFRKP
jgi:hypothetical protein